jgi:hypothetical protein
MAIRSRAHSEFCCHQVYRDNFATRQREKWAIILQDCGSALSQPRIMVFLIFMADDTEIHISAIMAVRAMSGVEWPSRF